MTSQTIIVPDLMKHRALLLGEVGEKWLIGIGELLAEIENDWHVNISTQLSGGTEALVFLATDNRTPSVLKLGIPNSLAREAQTLQLAEGIGYSVLLAYDPAREALLLERLGSRLADASLTVERQIEIICATLKLAWRRIDDPDGLTTGAEKARAQADYIRIQWKALDRPCSQKLVEVALEYASQREKDFNPADSYLVHGDAHIWNTLEVPGSPAGYKFVDPDGLFAEPALDLAISLREWRDELLEGDALEVGQQRCELLSKLTDVDDAAIWQWGFIEHVSCGMLDLDLNDQKAAEQHFAIADRWVDS